MAGGRPTTYKPEYCELLIKCMSEGMSITEFSAEINVNLDTVYEWFKVHKEFSEAKKIGVQKSQAWWEKIARQHLVNYGEKSPSLNTPLWIFNMKNRFKWTDRQETEITGKDGGPIELAAISAEERRQRLLAESEKLKQLTASDE